MCTIENSDDLCKSLLEAALDVMVSVTESCGRDTRVTSRVGAHKKVSRATRPLALVAGGVLSTPIWPLVVRAAAACVSSTRRGGRPC